MRVAILHLSDIHLQSRGNTVQSKRDHIVDAFQNHALDADVAFLLLTGDIAFSGKEDEYLQALDLLDNIQSRIEEYAKKKLQVILIPGNHDCDHSCEGSSVRAAVIEKVLVKGAEAIDTAVIDQCCSPQKEWREFAKTYSHEGNVVHDDNLLKVLDFSVGEYNIVFYCYNTSWVSRLKETAGSMHFPVEYYAPDVFKRRGNLVVSLLHHPFSWQQHSSQRSFRTHIEKTSDIVFTGHEHIPSKSVKDDLEGNYTEFIEGAVLQDSADSANSAFNVVVLDLKNELQCIHQYFWNGEYYSSKNPDSEWLSYKRYKNINKRIFEISNVFSHWLSDPGASFSHPRKRDLVLEDIFVCPSLIDMKKERAKDDRDFERVISGTVLCNIKPQENRILVIGEESSGKTTLCKIMFKHYYNNEIVPVYLQGGLLKSGGFDEFMKGIRTAFAEQYSRDLFERFDQLGNDKKLIIIDDLDTSRISPRHRTDLIQGLLTHYRNVVVTASDFFQVEELFQKDASGQSLFEPFDQYQLLEFGHVARSRLITKWHSLSDDQSIDESTLIRTHDSTKQIVDTIVGNNLVPSYPIFLLTIMQSVEAGRPHDLTESTYGHYYAFLITGALGRLRLPHDDIDAYFNYLTELAFRFFSTKRTAFGDQELGGFHDWFCAEYKLRLPFAKIRGNFLEASILEEKIGNYGFKYPYVYYFFVAKRLANTIAENETRTTVSGLCRKLHHEENANIILFLTHHCKDPYIIGQLLDNATTLFKDVPPIRMEGDVEPLAALITDVPRLVLEDKTVQDAREEHFRSQDEAEIRTRDADSMHSPEPGDNALLDFVANLNTAYKTVEIIGLVLKNYYGSLRGTDKYQIGEQAYLLSLRSLNSVFSLITSDRDAIVADVCSFIEENNLVEKAEIEKAARNFVFHLVEFFCFSFIKKTGKCLGSEKLVEILSEIRKAHDFPAVRLIDISIKLDFFRAYPHNDIVDMHKLLEGKLLPHLLLKRLVLHYLYMFPVDYKERQRICNTLGITMRTQRTIEMVSARKKKG